MSLSPTKIATVEVPSVIFKTPPSSNAFKILWEVVDGGVAVAVAPAAITIDFKTILPKGTEIAFESSPYDATVNQVPIIDSIGGLSVSATVTGLTGTQEVHFYVGGIY